MAINLVDIEPEDAAAQLAHALLSGWQHARHEIRAEMIPDLEALAEHGVRPTVATHTEIEPTPRRLPWQP